MSSEDSYAGAEDLYLLIPYNGNYPMGRVVLHLKMRFLCLYIVLKLTRLSDNGSYDLIMFL